MPTVLALSSSVAASRVGLSVMVPALQALDVEVIAVPTVTLGRHPGWGAPGGAPVPAEVTVSMVEAVAAHPAFAACDWMATGYFADPAQVALAADLLARLRAANPGARYLCDPIMGDAPQGLYVPREVAEALAERLAPEADIITPNAWELERLAGRAAVSPLEAAAIAQETFPGAALVSSVADPDRPGAIATVYAEGEQAWAASVARRDPVPGGGLGDLLAGLFLGYVAQGWAGPDALGAAIGGLEAALDRAGDGPELPGGGLGAMMDAARAARVATLAGLRPLTPS
ncbi:MAG: bifunctional hydroxymethylpyrimidine kinase/phosphomethylpyrimidine kinase [Caulobacterales bacterium]|nr:bifunctional hydroxymethylpyrimidine kinase/phosphomethylpyrimidine kinase [Caulobacterales bacterium]